MTPTHPRRFFPLCKLTKAPQCWRKASTGSGILGISERFRYPTKACRAMRNSSNCSASVSGDILILPLPSRRFLRPSNFGRRDPSSLHPTIPEIPEILRGRNHCKKDDRPQQNLPEWVQSLKPVAFQNDYRDGHHLEHHFRFAQLRNFHHKACG